jgi:sugar lactone lactonase YvrE
MKNKLFMAYLMLSFSICFFPQAANAQFKSSFLAGRVNGFSDGIGLAANFSSPTGMVYDGIGNLYIADRDNSRIRKVVISTGEVTTIAGNGQAGFADGIGLAAKFFTPTGLIHDGAGNLYVADQGNNRIRKLVIGTGEVTTLAGGTEGFYDSKGVEAMFSRPYGITYDGLGNLYISDQNNHRIRKAVIATKEVTTLAGNDQAGQTDGIGIAARFFVPCGITTDGLGNLFITDSETDLIRKIVIATGEVTTLAGSTWGNSDGIGSAAQFKAPMGISYDGIGNLLIADFNGHSIRKVTISTAEVTTIAGGKKQGYKEGIGDAIEYQWPEGITCIKSGLFATSEWNNDKVRLLTEITLSGFPLLAKRAFSLLPNPVKSQVNINWNIQKANIETIQLLDMSGKVQRIYSLPQTTLSLEGLAPGLYLVQAGGERASLVVE